MTSKVSAEMWKVSVETWKVLAETWKPGETNTVFGRDEDCGCL